MSKLQLPDLGPTIECLEDSDFKSSVLRSQNYADIISSLQDARRVDVAMAKRLLNICLMDLAEDLQYSINNMMIISLILKKIKEGKCDESLNQSELFEKTARAIVQLSQKVLQKSLFRKLSIDTLLLHPDEILRSVVTDHMQEFVNLIDYHPTPIYDSEVTEKVLTFLERIFKVLPPASHLQFVKCGLKAWFNTIIPGVMTAVKDNPEALSNQAIEVLETLVGYLVKIDYSEYILWLHILKDISQTAKYPAIMRKLVENKHRIWHRLWIIFIRLLKDQITQLNKSGMSPINSLLPVVEGAFKLDPTSRCRAFECWRVLVDNFSTELNESMISKRLKLLIIPLKLNNAKVPETIAAKVSVWWHLIRRFQSRLDKYTDTVFIPFLRFCFGSALAVMSDVTKRQCVEALVEIIGHVDCEGCVSIDRLNGRLISIKLLVDHWIDWVNAVSVAIKISSKHYNESENETEMKKLRCLWKGLVLTVAELPANQIRADLIVELLKLVDNLKRERVNQDLVFKVLIGSLFENDDRIKQLLASKSCEGPAHVILTILNSSDMNLYYKSYGPEELIEKLNPIMQFFMDPKYSDPDGMVLLWMRGFYDTKLILWAALAEAICGSKHELTPKILNEFVVWPFNVPASPEALQISESEAVWYKWFTLYSYVHPRQSKRFDEAIMKDMRPGGNFSFLASIALLKQQFCLSEEERFGNMEHRTKSLLKSVEEIKDFKSLEQYVPILLDTLVLWLENAIKPKNFNLMQTAVSTVTALLKHVNAAVAVSNHTIDLTIYECLMKPIGSILKSEKCLAKVLITPLIDELCSWALHTTKHPDLKDELIKILTLTLSIYHKGTYMNNKVSNTIAQLKTDAVQAITITNEAPINNNKERQKTVVPIKVVKEISHDKNSVNSNDTNITPQKATKMQQASVEKHIANKDFSKPPTKSAKKTKNKQPDIVNTTVENGVEFVVVKSHWKFNPKKLTENQKERLKRKREDIPALYQDLSQSQDEFKLVSFPDSQDASMTDSSKSESNSKTNEETTNILKSIPSTEVVSKIVENNFTDTVNKDNDKPAEMAVEKKSQPQKTPTTKDPKTPRIALKDRVFRNVRNLIEKSGTQCPNKVDFPSEDMNQTLNENNLKTPLNKVHPLATVPYSAPSKISTERPVRAIKKPKKFDNTELFALKKRKRSQGSSPRPESPAVLPEFTNQNSAKTYEEVSQLSTIEISEISEIVYDNNATKTNKGNNDVTFTETNIVENDANSTIANKSVDNVNTTSINKIINEVNTMNAKDAVKETATSTNVKNVENKQAPELPRTETHIAETPVEPVPRLPDLGKPISQIDDSQIHDNIEKHNNMEQSKEHPVAMETVVENLIENTPVKQASSKQNDDSSQVIEEISTPKPAEKRKDNDKSTGKKKRSRIETQLLIDMVEGHPLLQQSRKRATRKELKMDTQDSVSKRRKSFIEKSYKLKAELESAGILDKDQDKEKTSPKCTKTKSKEQLQEQSELINNISLPYTVTSESSSTSDDLPMSEDVIESSQESTITTISVKSTSKKDKSPPIRLDVHHPFSKTNNSDTQKILAELNDDVIILSDNSEDESNEDNKMPNNKTAETQDKDLTEEMVTESLNSEEVILLNDEDETPVVINTEGTPSGKDTQELAEADTQPMDTESQIPPTDEQGVNNTANDTTLEKSLTDNDITYVPSQDSITPTMSGTAEVINDIIQESSNTGSPLKDVTARKKEFLNDTVEISPIKILSPINENKSPETSNVDYVVIKLATPVRSNGEPYDEPSPEIFTEDKISPDKRDQSPPRKEVTSNNTSPTSSLSLKKNRPQMRFNGRAAQMLQLCAPDDSRIPNEDAVKSSPVSSPARRNLRKVYNTENADNHEPVNTEENEKEKFLRFTRALPTSDCSPSGPILKRKLTDSADEGSASKRKRVSFHDPPVSTTVAVHKYIESGVIRSPSNSNAKRLERQSRASTNGKSPKRLENSFRLETVLTKAAESFSEEPTVSNDTQISLDETPAVEIVKTSELNDKDSICPELLDCRDPIENIAGELSSPSTKALLIKELEGKVETIADLAKLTELEVNRLCIKAPKVKVAKKVLTDYAAKRAKTQEIAETPTEALVRPPQVQRVSMEVQTIEVPTRSTKIQTEDVATSRVHTQTEAVATSHCSAQTNESGYKSTKDVVASCLTERADFVQEITRQLDETSVRKISEKLPVDDLLSLLANKITAGNSHNVFNYILNKCKDFESKGMDLKMLQDFLCDRFDSKDTMLFCIQLLQKLHAKPI